MDDAKHNRVMAAVAFSQGYGHNNNTMLNVSNVVCIPTYQIRKASVTMDPANNVLDVQPLDGNISVLPMVSGYDIAQGVLMSLGSATNIASEGASLDAFFTMIENFNAHAFLEDTVLQSATQKLYTKIAVQVASRFLINLNNPAPAIAGSTSTVANRLVVRDVPLRFMEALLLLMLAITIFVIIAAPKAAVPRPMDSIAGLATVLARSPSLTTILTGTGYLPFSKIREILKDHEFQTSVEHQSSQSVFSIHAKANVGQDLPADAKATRISVTKTMDHDKQASSKAVEHFITKASSQGHTEAAVTWIRPLTFSPTVKAALILTPCLMIVALEVLLRHSNANAGLVDITAGSSERYGWLYIPTLLVVLLGTMFNMLDSDMELFSPYHVLSAGYCGAETSLLRCSSGQILIQTAWRALRQRKIALFAASVSVLIAPFPTNVVSGLFTVQAVPLVQPVECQALDWFNTTGTISEFDGPKLGSLIVEGNMSYPQWTYGNVALPSIETLPGNLHASTLAIRSPALRAGLRCVLIPQDQYINTTYESSHGGTGPPSIVLNMTNPGQCATTMTTIQNSLSPVAADGEFGMMFGPLAFGGPDPEACPGYMAFYGQMKSGAVEHLAGFNCNPYLERVEVDLVYNVPD